MAQRKEEELPQRNRLEMELEAYLELDKASKKIKYEYLHGYAYALAGGTIDHDTISGNAYSILDTLLSEEGRCKPHGPNVKVFFNETEYVYPDAFVTCDGEELEGTETEVRSPTLVIEVLSPGTEKEDRGEKFVAYQSIASLHTYILVNTRYQWVEVFRRGDPNWTYATYQPGEMIAIPELDCQQLRLSNRQLLVRPTCQACPSAL